MIIGGFMVFNCLMNMGPNATTYLLSGETFPTSIRAPGAGFAASMAKLWRRAWEHFYSRSWKAQFGITPLLARLGRQL